MISTRARILMLSAVTPFLFALLNLALQVNDSIKAILIPVTLSLLMAVGQAWVVNFQLKGERRFTVLAFPAVSIAVFTAFLDAIISTTLKPLDRVTTIIAASFLVSLVSYIVLSSINILNLAAMRNIPLGQAGRAANYIMTMVFSYFGFVLLVSSELTFALKAGGLLALVFCYCFISLWTIGMPFRERLSSSLAIGVLELLAFTVLSMWPLQSFYFAVFLTFFFYMTLGVALEIRETVKRWIWYEYAAIFAVMFVLLITTADWGINGIIL